MARSPINSGEVVWSGENPIVSLKEDPQAEESTNVTFFRIVWSPAGIGHAAFVSTPSLGNRPRGYTDNMTLGRWLRDEMLKHYAHYAKKPIDQIPLAGARFTWSGDARRQWEERIVAEREDLRLMWSNLGAPFVVNNPGGSTGAFPFHVISVFIPAQAAALEVNGLRAAGRAFPRNIAGMPSSTCFLAFSETWLTLPS
jgi:hypothetical protein